MLTDIKQDEKIKSQQKRKECRANCENLSIDNTSYVIGGYYSVLTFFLFIFGAANVESVQLCAANHAPD